MTKQKYVRYAIIQGTICIVFALLIFAVHKQENRSELNSDWLKIEKCQFDAICTDLGISRAELAAYLDKRLTPSVDTLALSSPASDHLHLWMRRLAESPSLRCPESVASAKMIILGALEKGLMRYADSLIQASCGFRTNDPEMIALSGLSQLVQARDASAIFFKVRHVNKALELISNASLVTEDNYFVRVVRFLIHARIPKALASMPTLAQDLNYLLDHYDRKVPIPRVDGKGWPPTIEDVRIYVSSAHAHLDQVRPDLKPKLKGWGVL